MPLIPAVAQAPFAMGTNEWLFVALTSAIIFLILGKKLWRDIQGWIANRRPTNMTSGPPPQAPSAEREGDLPEH